MKQCYKTVGIFFIWYPDALSDSLSGILQLRALLNTHIFKTILKVKTTVSVDLIN